MEELRSTDFLDQEIEEEAKKRAATLLKTADEQCALIQSQIPERLENARKEKEKFYADKEAKFKRDLDSSLALEKSRFLVSYISSSVISAVGTYLSGLDTAKRISLYADMLASKEDLVKDKKFNMKIYGLEEADVRKGLEGKYGIKILECTQTDFVHSGEEDIEGLDLHEGIILEDENRLFKCRLTIEQLVSSLQDKNNRELAVALFGGRLPE